MNFNKFSLLPKLSPELQAKLKQVKLFLCDVDGVLTDGSTLMGQGVELKRFSVVDGLGLRLLIDNGIRVGWISNRPSQATAARAEELGIEFVFQQRGNKIAFAEQILEKTGLTWADTCYVGDDIVDLCMFRKVPLAIAVKDAHPLAKELAHYITKKKGGRGAIREMAELILQAQEKWENIEILQRGL